jgi:hypothetical protein
VEFVFTITQGRTGTKSLAELFKRHDSAAHAAHEYLDASAHGTITPDVGHMRRFNTEGLTPEVASFWTHKFATHREEAARFGKQRYVETAHMNAMCGLVEYVLAAESAQHQDRFRFIVLNRAPEKIARSLYERNDLRHIENMWLWYLDPKYPRKYVDATPYVKQGYLGTLMWYVREVEARKTVYAEMLRGRHEVLTVDIDQPDWADIVSRSYGFEIPNDGDTPHTNQNKPSRKRTALEQMLKEMFAELPSAGTDELADGVGHPTFGRRIEDPNRQSAIA